MLVSVRGGGHGVGGHAVCDGGLMIDLSPMKRARPTRPPADHRAGRPDLGRVRPADPAVRPGRPGGIITHTGISGLTLGGGIGWLMRKHGATVDSLRSVQVVRPAASWSPRTTSRIPISSGASGAAAATSAS
jgi:FAD/FMN-containing dehydrogenase